MQYYIGFTDDDHRWDKETYDAAREEREEAQSEFNFDARQKPNTKQQESIAEQAKAVLRGKNPWKKEPELDEWEDVGEAVEVEQDVQVPPVKQ